nr:MAG TPA_asm: YvrJ protein family protein [Bacteriophage sp.]
MVVGMTTTYFLWRIENKQPKLRFSGGKIYE